MLGAGAVKFAEKTQEMLFAVKKYYKVITGAIPQEARYVLNTRSGGKILVPL